MNFHRSFWLNYSVVDLLSFKMDMTVSKSARKLKATAIGKK